MIKMGLGFIALIMMNSSVFAHTGMEHSAVSHSFIHLVITAGITLTIIAAGYYRYRSLPKVKRIRIKK